MECISCNNEMIINNNNNEECICPIFLINKGEGKCEKCENGLAMSKNNQFCVKCLSINGSLLNPDNKTGKCPDCGDNEIKQLLGDNKEQCIKCPNETIPDINKENCIQCLNNYKCFCNNSKNINLNICNQLKFVENLAIIPLLPNENYENNQENQFISEFIFQNVQNSALLCQQKQSTKHCQQLANFCTLQDYPRKIEGGGGGGESCCILLELIKKQIQQTEEIANQLIPQLFFTNIEASTEIFKEGEINGIYTFGEENQKNNKKLEIIAIVFDQKGNLIGEWSISDDEEYSFIFQLCFLNNNNKEQKGNEFKFGYYFKQKCQLNLMDILKWNKMWNEENYEENEEKFILSRTMFFELYLRYKNDEGEIVLKQIPIINEDLRGDQYIGYYGNRLGDNILKGNTRLLLTKRFYLVDIQKNIKITKNTENEQLQQYLIRVPKRISLHIHFEQLFDGHIYIPYLQLSHYQYLIKLTNNKINNTKILAQTNLTTLFSIEYHTENYTYDKCIEVIMSTLCSLAAIWAGLQTYSWCKRSGKIILIDASTIIKLLFYAADSIGNVFILIMGSACIWLIYSYKLQTNIHYIPLNGNQENSFIAYMISAMALKGISLLHTLLTLILVKTFFIDWERPRLLNNYFDNNKIKNKKEEEINFEEINEQQKQENRGNLNTVVIWRTYLIANEWNELQMYRKTHIGIQMLLMLLIMEYLEFGNWAKIQPGFERYNQLNGVIETKMSRFAINLSFYLIIGITQWIIQVILIERLIDPFRNFMDLCSIANISVLTLTNPLRGYYIHGRSVHGYADTDMLQMNTFLQREKENVCSLRGLENGQDLQTFICNLPLIFNERINQILEEINFNSGSGEINGQKNNGQFERKTIKMEQQAKVYNKLNNYLKDFINQINPQNGEYKCIDEYLIEQLLNIELTNTNKIGIFKRDKSEISYSSVFIYGNEWSLMSFEMILFCVIDMFWLNRIFSAILVYLFSKLILLITKIFFTNQLAKSCLVDNRFLI